VPVILDNLSHTFNGNDFLFNNLVTEFNAGETYALIGPSGSGKSTLLSIISGMLKPTSGKVELQGISNIHWVFQNPHGVTKRTVLDHVALPILARGEPANSAEKIALEYLQMFHLEYAAFSEFRSISGGEAQRLMLARALASKPDLLLVDEPTASLDTKTALEVSNVLMNLKSTGTIVIIATHDEKVKNACSKITDLTSFSSSPEII
jgi:ABC-type lipoprotein export system ATPase subunit